MTAIDFGEYQLTDSYFTLYIKMRINEKEKFVENKEMNIKKRNITLKSLTHFTFLSDNRWQTFLQPKIYHN